MRVELESGAESDLDGIWDWTAERYSVRQADEYRTFVEGELAKLVVSAEFGRPVPKRPHLKYSLMKRRKRGHGHIAVYFVEPHRVVVIRIFHTAQDWVPKLG